MKYNVVVEPLSLVEDCKRRLADNHVVGGQLLTVHSIFSSAANAEYISL